MITVPLAEKLRPHSLEEIVGQDHLLGTGGFLTHIIKGAHPLSLLLFGPPGCGKTTLARLYAQSFRARLITISAMFSSSSELKALLCQIQEHPLLYQHSILFIDEIHRLNRAQQDLFLPHLETGKVILIGATTENPSFALNSALLSRLRVLALEPLSTQSLNQLLNRVEQTIPPLHFTENARKLLIESSHGDARHLLNVIENLLQGGVPQEIIDTPQLEIVLQQRLALYDKEGDGHYQCISALHKAVRGSDPDAALYWLARLLEGGESPQYIARRMLRIATEDIGLADPHALGIAINAWRSFEQLGHPEGELALAQAVLYLSLAPKSNAVYTAFQKAQECAKKTSHYPPPLLSLNAPTSWMQKSGYGQGYAYDHDTPCAFSGQNYFPNELPRQVFYAPKEYGFEREMKKRRDYFDNLRSKLNK